MNLNSCCCGYFAVNSESSLTVDYIILWPTYLTLLISAESSLGWCWMSAGGWPLTDTFHRDNSLPSAAAAAAEAVSIRRTVTAGDDDDAEQVQSRAAVRTVHSRASVLPSYPTGSSAVPAQAAPSRGTGSSEQVPWTDGRPG